MRSAEPGVVTATEDGAPRQAVLYGMTDCAAAGARSELSEAGERLAGGLRFELVDECIEDVVECVKPWPQRAQAARLLRGLEHRGSQVEVVFIVEPERAFVGDDLVTAVALISHHGVEVHLPDGPVHLRTRRLRQAVQRIRRYHRDRWDSFIRLERAQASRD